MAASTGRADPAVVSSPRPRRRLGVVPRLRPAARLAELADEDTAGLPFTRAALTPRPQPPWLRQLVLVLVALDFGLALTAAVLSLVLRFGRYGGPYYLGTLAFPFVWCVAIGLSRAYETRFLGAGSEEYRRVFDGSLRLFAVVAAVAYAAKLEFARGYVFSAFPLALVLTLAGRVVARTVLTRQRALGRWSHSVLAVGSERSVAELQRQLAREPGVGFCLVGLCVDGAVGRVIEGVAVIADTKSIIEGLQSTGADTVMVTAYSRLGQEEMRRLSWQLEGSGVALVVTPSVTDVTGPRIHIRPVAGLPLLHVEEPELTGARRIMKATLDRSAAILGLLLGAPLLLAIAVLVRVTSPGPALFRQTRVGAHGTTFTVYKFRSMVDDAEEQLHALLEHNVHGDSVLFKIQADPRVTRVGRVLRRFSLDELPQLLNVLRGDMSLVGPRPPLPREVERYADDVRRRLLVKPGVTGLWQVSGRSDLTWEQSVRLDLNYVENWSLALDLQILAKTVAAVLHRQGAY